MPRLAASGSHKPTEEKITVNLGVIDLGSIDLLVREGFYSNRTDFIRTAIRNQVDKHQSTVGNVVAEQTLVMGLRHIDVEELRALKAADRQIAIRVLGLLTIGEDVTPRLARATIESITVLGAFQASAEIKRALADRMA